MISEKYVNILVSMFLVCQSCTTSTTINTDSKNFQQLIIEANKGFPFDALKKEEFVIQLDKEKIRRYNLSLYSVGQEIQKLLQGPDSITLNTFWTREITFHNNEGRLISISLDSLRQK